MFGGLIELRWPRRSWAIIKSGLPIINGPATQLEAGISSIQYPLYTIHYTLVGARSLPATGGGHELLVIEINWRRTQFAGDIADIDTNSRERKRLWPFIVWLFDSQVPLEPVFWPGKESGQQSGAEHPVALACGSS